MTGNDKTWIKIAPCASIPPREGRCIELNGRQIAIFHTTEGFFAVENRCPHRGGPLADGIVNGTAVVCPLHAWKFDLRSGISTNHPESSDPLTNYPICIEDDVLCISLPEGSTPGEITTVGCEHRDRPIRWVQRKPSPSATRPGNFVSGGSPSASDPPPNERPQSNGYVSQKL
jgi:nitrite reductase (NADH) small subunit